MDMLRTRELLQKAIDLRGVDYVDHSNAYVDDDEPGCLIGVMLWLDGTSLSVLEDLEGQCASTVLAHLGYPIKSAVFSYWDELQDMNDAGYKWGEIDD